MITARALALGFSSRNSRAVVDDRPRRKPAPCPVGAPASSFRRPLTTAVASLTEINGCDPLTHSFAREVVRFFTPLTRPRGPAAPVLC